jgi:TatD DNase family protein
MTEQNQTPLVTSPLFDTHCHLNHPRLSRRLEEVLRRAAEVGVEHMLVAGYDLPSSRAAVELAGRYQGLWASVGVHPHDAQDLTDDTLRLLRELAQHPKVVAIGETGLDYYRDLSPRPLQREALLKQLNLAGELGLPAIIHCREAQDDLLGIIETQQQPDIIYHCFDGTAEQAQRALAAGMMLGFGGRVTHRAGRGLLEITGQIPEESLLLETDAPYLAPEPVRSRDNEPANLPLIAQAIARARGTTVTALSELTTKNAMRAFKLNEETA